MDILDRYLNAVQGLLPKAQKKDIVAELSEDLRSQIEEQEAGLGRALNETEVEAILSRMGHPILVASRYQPQRSLIGPALFPLYAFVLKIVALCYTLPWLLVWLCYVLFVPSYRAGHPGFSLLDTLDTWWAAALTAFAGVTLIFALIERHQARTGFLNRWSPRRLPAAKDPNWIPRATSIGDLTGGLLFLLWWVDVLRFPRIADLRIALSPAWNGFFWPLLIVVLASVILAGVNVVRPWWTRRRTAFQIAVDAATVIVLGFLLQVGPWIEIAIPGARPEALSRLVRWANVSVGITLAAIALAHLLGILRGIRRLNRGNTLPMATISGQPLAR